MLNVFCLPPSHQLYLYPEVKEKMFEEYRQPEELRKKAKFIIMASNKKIQHCFHPFIVVPFKQ